MFWGWSLALEEQFYLVVPLLFFLLSRLRSNRMQLGLLGVIWAAALVVRLVMYFRHDGPWIDVELYGALYFRTYTRFDTLITGIILAIVHDRFRVPIGKWLETPFHRAMLAMPSLTCLWMLLRPWTFLPKNLNFFHVFAWGTLTTLMWMGFLVLLLHGHGVVHRFLSAPIFRRIATLGYGVYLVHIPICDHIVVRIAAQNDRGGHFARDRVAGLARDAPRDVRRARVRDAHPHREAGDVGPRSRRGIAHGSSGIPKPICGGGTSFHSSLPSAIHTMLSSFCSNSKWTRPGPFWPSSITLARIPGT